MVTVKFETEKLNGEIAIIFPTIMATTNNKKNHFAIGLSWLKSLLTISVSWSHKIAKAPSLK